MPSKPSSATLNQCLHSIIQFPIRPDSESSVTGLSTWITKQYLTNCIRWLCKLLDLHYAANSKEFLARTLANWRATLSDPSAVTLPEFSAEGDDRIMQTIRHFVNHNGFTSLGGARLNKLLLQNSNTNDRGSRASSVHPWSGSQGQLSYESMEPHEIKKIIDFFYHMLSGKAQSTAEGAGKAVMMFCCRACGLSDQRTRASLYERMKLYLSNIPPQPQGALPPGSDQISATIHHFVAQNRLNSREGIRLNTLLLRNCDPVSRALLGASRASSVLSMETGTSGQEFELSYDNMQQHHK
uniref:Uncharacterized protein n=1 Tax=Moniliophthora roreri TaxID=221103 RepID=A0A0W0FPW3_MONRR